MGYLQMIGGEYLTLTYIKVYMNEDGADAINFEGEHTVLSKKAFQQIQDVLEK